MTAAESNASFVQAIEGTQVVAVVRFREEVAIREFRGNTSLIRGFVSSRAFIAVALAALVIAASGCGDQTAQARQYMEEGDQALSLLQVDSQAFEEKIQSFQQEASSGDVSTSAEMNERIEELESISARLKAGYADAKASYETINTLKGVNDYARYADLRIKGLTKLTELTDTYLEFLRFLSDTVQKEETGQAVDPEAANARASEISDSLLKLNEEVQRLDDEAKKLRTEKNLDQT